MKNNSVASYVKWVVNQIHELATTQQHYVYKIVGKDICPKTKEEKLIIQVTGKNTFFQTTPRELMADEATLRGFSPLDVRSITYLACGLKDKPEDQKKLYQIITQFFSKSKNREMFTLGVKDHEMRITKSAQEISSDPEFLKNLDPEDAHRVGYVTGTEHAVAEKDFIRLLKEGSGSGFDRG